MNNNLREDPIAVFGAQSWLLPKRNPGGVLLPEEAAQDQVTAEWGNRVDAALRQVSEAFNGLPVNAANVRGRLRGSRGGTQREDEELRLELFSGLAEGHWVHVEALAYASATAGSADNGEHFVLAHSSRLFRRQDDQVLEQATLVDTTPHVADEGAVVRFLLLGEAPDIVVAQLSVDAPSDIDWVVDYTLRAVPGSVTLPAEDQSARLAIPHAPEGLLAEQEPPTYLVADLPDGRSPGQTAWATDARKQGEKANKGTGVLAYWDGEGWRRLRDDKPVTM